MSDPQQCMSLPAARNPRSSNLATYRWSRVHRTPEPCISIFLYGISWIFFSFTQRQLYLCWHRWVSIENTILHCLLEFRWHCSKCWGSGTTFKTFHACYTSRKFIGTPFNYLQTNPVLNVSVGIRIRMFLGLPDPDPLVSGMDMDPDLAPNPSIFS